MHEFHRPKAPGHRKRGQQIQNGKEAARTQSHSYPVRDSAGLDLRSEHRALEALLGASPAKRRRRLSTSLIEHFGSFAAVVFAPKERLLNVISLTRAELDRLREFQELHILALEDKVRVHPDLRNTDILIRLLRAKLAHEVKEQLMIFLLNNRFQFVGFEHTRAGTVDHCPVYIREVIHSALKFGATKMILSHNHPSGNPTPSLADIDLTRKIKFAAQPLGIELYDHIVVGREGHASMKNMGLI